MILSTLLSSSLSSTASSPSCGSLYELRPGLVFPTAHVKFPVRRGISSGHDELDRPSHLLLFFPFIGYFLDHQLIQLRHHSPYLSFIRRSRPSLCWLFVVVVDAFSGGRCGLRVGFGFFGGLLVFLRGRSSFTWLNVWFAGASRRAPMF
jgi:hypothetical protein